MPVLTSGQKEKNNGTNWYRKKAWGGGESKEQGRN
jgi:hypothetical protein